MKDDTISRQAAIDALEELDWYHQNINKDMVSGANSAEHQAWYKADDVYKTIEELPTIEPERKKGKWIGRGDDAFECSECHAVIEGDEVYWRNNYFCYHCGAKMERIEE